MSCGIYWRPGRGDRRRHPASASFRRIRPATRTSDRLGAIEGSARRQRSSLALQRGQRLDEICPEDRMVFTHREVADVLHLDEGGVADLRCGAGAVTGGGEVV